MRSATNENDPTGALQSFTIGPQGVLTTVGNVSSEGGAPAFCVPLSTGQVAIMNVSWSISTLCDLREPPRPDTD